MSYELRYGVDSTLRMDLPVERLRTHYVTRDIVPLSDPAAAVAAAISHPLDFPALHEAVMPGDRVVVALDRNVPQAASIVAGVVHSLLEGRCEPHDICIVCAASEAEEPAAPTELLPLEMRQAIQVIRHDPKDSQSFGYLATSRAGKPIYFHRALCDADVVAPISALRMESSLGYVGVHGGLYPAFANEETQRRFRAVSAADWPALQRRWSEEAEEAAWLLGVLFTIQVVPGPGDSVLHVLAGETHAIADRGRRLCEAAWLVDSPERASLVVATIEGGREQQTWDNFARALFTASQLVADDGAIVLCTDLRGRPGPSMQRLAGMEDDDDVMRALRRDRASDALSAALLLETRQRARVYLLSGLDGETVEDLGLAPVSEAREIERLSRQHESCILLPNAHHAALPALV